MNVLLAFVIGVVVGVVVYIISTMVPFLAEYAGLLGFLAFLLAAFLSYRRV
jgi:hypothetical protein